jgi:hypothetical protein
MKKYKYINIYKNYILFKYSMKNLLKNIYINKNNSLNKSKFIFISQLKKKFFNLQNKIKSYNNFTKKITFDFKNLIIFKKYN